MKRPAALLFAVLALVAAACTGNGGGGGGGGGSSGGTIDIVLWHGYELQSSEDVPGVEAKALDDLVAAFNASHPGIYVKSVYCCTNDDALQKLTVSLQGGQQPDITYQYGTSMAQLAQAPGILDLTDRVQASSFRWDDFFPGARAAATVDGKVLGIPALIDNLAIVYNKDLFDAAGVSYPTADWTWDDFRIAAKALTDPAKKQFGFAFPADASEDTVWHFDAMLWEGGGSILSSDGKHAAFDSPAGETALTALTDMAVTDRSVYLDQQNTQIDNLFNSGKIGMVVTGPWALGGYPDVHYGVQIMPSFPGGNHQTIAGPDMWVLFDKGNGRADAAWTFVSWMTDTQQQVTETQTDGHLPTRASVLDSSGYTAAFGQKFPGNDVFAENLQNVQQARPILASYDQISQAMGQAVVAAMLGQTAPADALSQAADKVDQILSLTA
jgi:multiple sugar transport system substrate-binding protein